MNFKPLYTKEEMKKLYTAQLLKQLRDSYGWHEYDWTPEDYARNEEYRKELKEVLATRPHLPNKKESKENRKAKIKKGV